MWDGGAGHPWHRSVIVTRGHLAGGDAPGGAHSGPAGGQGRTNPQSVSAYPDRPRFWSSEWGGSQSVGRQPLIQGGGGGLGSSVGSDLGGVGGRKQPKIAENSQKYLKRARSELGRSVGAVGYRGQGGVGRSVGARNEPELARIAGSRPEIARTSPK